MPPQPQTPSPEDLAQSLVASGASEMPQQRPPSRWPARRKLLVAILIAGIGVGASAMSCVGQSFSLRQARALEGIEHHLQTMVQRGCSVPSVPVRGQGR